MNSSSYCVAPLFLIDFITVTLSVNKDFRNNWINAINRIWFSNISIHSRAFCLDCWALSARDQVLPLKEILLVGTFKFLHLKEEFILKESHIQYIFL